MERRCLSKQKKNNGTHISVFGLVVLLAIFFIFTDINNRCDCSGFSPKVGVNVATVPWFDTILRKAHAIYCVTLSMKWFDSRQNRLGYREIFRLEMEKYAVFSLLFDRTENARA